MKIIVTGATALALLTGAAMAAGIDGTWKASTDSAQAPKKPEVYVITAKDYTCKTCTPAFSVPVDGNYHPVKGNPYWDAVAIRLNSNSVTEMDFRKGKQVATSTTTISSDGKTATTSFEDSSASTVPVKGIVVARRTAAGKAGEHPASGSWQTVAYSSFNDAALTISYKTNGDSITMSTPTGQGYTAKLGGPAAPYKGDPGTDMVQVKMDGKSLVETDMRGGKVTSIATSTPSADGKSLNITVENKLKGNRMSFSAKKM